MEGRVRAPAQGPFCRDPVDPGMGSFFRVLGMKNNENENPAALGCCGGLGQLWEALAELWEALGGSEQQLMTPDLEESSGSVDEFQIVQIIRVFTAKVTRVTLRCNVFF